MTYAYVANSGSDTVTVIDTSTNTVSDTITVGGQPWGIAATPDGTHVYVTNSSYSGTVAVIDTSTNTVSDTITVGGYPEPIVITPDGKHAYVGNTNDHTVSAIDTSTHSVIATISVGGTPVALAVSPDSAHVYAGIATTNPFVSVIATATNSVVTTFGAGVLTVGPWLTVTSDGNYIYASQEVLPGIVRVYSTASYSLDATITVQADPLPIAASPTGPYVYVANTCGTGAGGICQTVGTVSVIDTSTQSVVQTVNVGWGPDGLAFTPDGTSVYVANTSDGSISVIDTATYSVQTPVTGLPYPNGVAFASGPKGHNWAWIIA